LSGERLGEEIFVTLLGHKSVDDLRAAYPSKERGSWVSQLWDAIGSFFRQAAGLLSDVTGSNKVAMRQRLDDLDLSTATIWDFLNSVSYEMLDGTVREAVPRYAWSCSSPTRT
jgi:hypothetical protein